MTSWNLKRLFSVWTNKPKKEHMLKSYLQTFKGLSKEVWFLSFVLLINRAGSMVLPFLSVYLHQEIGLSLSNVGWIMSMYGLGALAGSYVGGELTDRFHFYPVMIFSLVTSSIGYISLQFAHGFYSFGALIFLTVFFADLFRPSSMTALGAYSKPEDYTRSVSLLRLAINLGYSLGPAIGGWVAYRIGYIPLFWIDGLTCLFAALAVRTFLRQKDMPKKEKKSKATKAEESPYRDKDYLIFIAMVSLMALVFLQLLTTLPVYFKDHFKMNEDQIGVLLALNAFLIVLIEMPIIHRLEPKSSKLKMVQIGTFFIGLSYFVFLLAPNWIWIAAINMFLLSIGEIFAMPFSNTYCMDLTTPENRGKYMALYSMAYSAAFILAPILGMQIASRFGFETLWIILSIISVFTIFGLGSIRRKHKTM